jgi:hypothetical protein
VRKSDQVSLVMDDEEALRILLMQILKRLGYEAECAQKNDVRVDGDSINQGSRPMRAGEATKLRPHWD